MFLWYFGFRFTIEKHPYFLLMILFFVNDFFLLKKLEIFKYL